jgi:hypothetical protein
MSPSTIALDRPTNTSVATSEEATLFDGLESRRNEASDDGVIPNDQASALLDALRQIGQQAPPADRDAAKAGMAQPAAKPSDPILRPSNMTTEPVRDPAPTPCELEARGPSLTGPAHNVTSRPAEVTPTGRPMPELPPKGAIAALGVRKGGTAPRRIGSGRLVPARLTWKPRDPFADPAPVKRSQFRWDTMLTVACATAALGLGFVWLVRSLFT